MDDADAPLTDDDLRQEDAIYWTMLKLRMGTQWDISPKAVEALVTASNEYGPFRMSNYRRAKERVEADMARGGGRALDEDYD